MKRGQFNIPIYVFCASGSPYWRQYIASSPTPPRSSYKLDFVFYVSSVQLMGTTKLYVLQAGSGEVVKSMLSKGDIYPRWKPMGLSFYAMKGPSSQGKPVSTFSFCLLLFIQSTHPVSASITFQQACQVSLVFAPFNYHFTH